MHVCHVYGCDVPVPPRMLMCRPHWAQVPREMQDAVYSTFNPQQCKRRGPIPTREWLKAARAALTHVEQAERQGGRR